MTLRMILMGSLLGGALCHASAPTAQKELEEFSDLDFEKNMESIEAHRALYEDTMRLVAPLQSKQADTECVPTAWFLTIKIEDLKRRQPSPVPPMLTLLKTNSLTSDITRPVSPVYPSDGLPKEKLEKKQKTGSQ